MDDRSSNSVMIVLIFAAVMMAFGIIAFGMIVFAGVNIYSDFNQPADIASIQQAVTNSGLQVCYQGNVNWSVTPGFISGKYYDISTNCSNHNPNKPGARAWIVRFSDVAARDSALRNFETTRRHIGSGIAWSNGPFIVIVDGNQNSSVIASLREAVASTGGQKGRG